jgi:hypothetical protein
MGHTKGKVEVTPYGGVVNYPNYVLRKNDGGYDCEPHTMASNAKRITTLWNAADGMSNEDAVKALEHYEDMKSALLSVCGTYCSDMKRKCGDCPIGFIGDKLTEGDQ